MPNVRRLNHLKDVLRAGIGAGKIFEVTHWNTCVGGWACDDPGFQAQGLTSYAGGCPRYNTKSGQEALGSFFDLAPGQAGRLFGKNPAMTPDGAIAEIDTFLTASWKIMVVSWWPTIHWFGHRRT